VRAGPAACRYGEVFKTHVLGCPCVILASPEAARMVLVSQAHLFKPTYPPSKERMIGAQALFFHQGDYHLRLRRLVQGWVGPDALRALVPDVEAAVASTLRGWEGRVTSTFHTMKTVSASQASTASERTPPARGPPKKKMSVRPAELLLNACAAGLSFSSSVRLRACVDAWCLP
jgi:cytochrome P450